MTLASTGGDDRKKLLIIPGLLLLVLVVFWQVGEFGFINLDDNLYVTNNYPIQSGLTYPSFIYAMNDIHTANWHPVTMISHVLDWELFGDKAGGHHWTNLILHIFNTALLFLLLSSMTGALWKSALVAALFAVHPVNVESVAWVAERKNVLSTFFWLLTMQCYVWYVRKSDWRRYVPVLISFALGLMSKPMLVTLPFVLLLMDYWPLNRTEIDTEAGRGDAWAIKSGRAKLSSLILEKIPLFILTAVSIGVTLYTQRAAGAIVTSSLLPLTERISNAIVSYGLYIKKMFWPMDLSVFYARYSIGPVKLAIAICVLFLLSTLALKYYRKRPYLVIGWFWFLGTLVPVIGLVQVGVQSMADRYAYVPLIGLFIVLAWFVGEAAEKSRSIKIGLSFCCVLVIFALSFTAWQRCQLWGDQLLLWNDVLNHQKVSLAYNLRGLAYADKGRYALALADYNAAIALDSKCSEAFNNRAIVHAVFGDKKEAFADYGHAIRLNPRFVDAYYNRGLMYLETRQLDLAIADFSTAIGIDSGSADYFNYRGVALRLRGDYEKSFDDFNQALKRNRNFAEAYFNRGLIYFMQRQNVPAVVNFTEALRIKPAFVDARFHRGLVLASVGQYQQAMKDFRNVLTVDPSHVPALKNLAITLRKMGRYEESRAEFEKILQIKPDDDEALKYVRETETSRK